MTNPLKIKYKYTILLFVKAPFQGNVKTRLAKTIGEEQAVKVFKDLVRAQIQRLPRDFQLEIHYTPSDAELEIKTWLGAHPCFPQVEGNLGAKLSAAIKGAFSRGASSVYCIGGDCPGLNISHFHDAQRQLEQGADLCFGPTEDGGYYLLAMRAPQTEILRDIPWSTPHTLAASITRSEALGLKVRLLEQLYDIDEEADLLRARQEGLL